MIIHQAHHGKMMAVDSELAGRHREHCLCWKGCAEFHPGEPNNCPVAQALYEFDVKHGVTTPVWECEHFREEA